MKKLFLVTLVLGLAISCDKQEEEPDKYGTLYAPDGLTVEMLTATSAELSWAASVGAETYNLVIGDLEPVKIAGNTTHTATGLEPATTYTWKVQAVNDSSTSDWAWGPAFTTDKKEEPVEPDDPEPITLFYNDGAYYGDAYYGKGTENFQLTFLDVDPYGDAVNATFLSLDIIAETMNTSSSVEFLEIPDGTYEITDSHTPKTVATGDYTYIHPIVNLAYGDKIPVTGGSVTIEGNTADGYSIRVDLLHAGGRFVGEYKGAISLKNPNYVIPAIDLGTLTRLNVMNYYANPFNDYSVDGYQMHVSEEGVTIQNSQYMGTGWAVELPNILVPSGSRRGIPDGTYDIGSGSGPMTVTAGSQSEDGRHGMWIVRVENNLNGGAYPIVGGTLTSAYKDGEYTISINGTTDKGTVVTGTIRVLWESPLPEEGAISGTPGDFNYDFANDNYDI